MKYAGIIVLIAIVATIAVFATKDEMSATDDTLSYKTNEESEHEQKEEKKPATPITKINHTTSGMTIDIITEGSGPGITNGQTAVVDYKGTLIDGSIFDESAKRGQPFSFPLGAGMVIKGWDEGVLGMKVGETRKLTIPPELGYGARGAGDVIPPNATLIFEVTLRAIK